jgi:glucose/arabinose dehydrogenase
MSVLQFALGFLLIVIHRQSINGANITFDPQPIRLTLADLPAPSNTSGLLNYATVIPVPSDPKLYVPKGFTVKPYFTGLQRPRYLQYSPEGNILVSESQMNRISCLLDTDNDGYPDKRVTIADETNGIEYPFGMAFVNGYLYSGNRFNVRRYKWIDCSEKLMGQGEIIMSYSGVRHITRTIIIPPTEDRMYVSIGSASNADIDPSPLASIQVADLNGANQRTFASGLRNAVGLTLHPVTHDLYTSCQERDEIGDELVPEYFTRVEENSFFGWPYSYLSSSLIDPRHQLENGSSVRPDLVALTRTPDVLIKSHSSALGATFYTGKQFPERYRNGAFIALRASGNRQVATGSKIMFIPFNSSTHRPVGYYEDFVYGFLMNETHPQVFAWPVGLLVLKDGSLLFTDDANNQTYQIQYIGETNSAFRCTLNTFSLIISSTFLVFLSAFNQ